MRTSLTLLLRLGDGTFFFAQMDSVYWISRRYDIPFLMVVLNNGGWEAPKVSALLVNDAGLASQVSKKSMVFAFFIAVAPPKVCDVC